MDIQGVEKNLRHPTCTFQTKVNKTILCLLNVLKYEITVNKYEITVNKYEIDKLKLT